MINNKKYAREIMFCKERSIYFSYLILNRVGFGLSLQAQHLTGRKRDENK